MVSAQPDTNGGSEKPSLPTHTQPRKISIIIPCLWANSDLYEMTIGCLDSLQHENAQIIVIANNESYTKNVNNALRAATGDIIVIGNNDLTFDTNTLPGLLRVLDEGYDLATCWTSDQKVELSEGIEQDAKFGSIFAMKRDVYTIVGEFDEQFGGYFADLDYRERVLDAGLRIGKNLNLVVEHEAKATYKQVDPNDDEYLRSMRLFEIKHGVVL